MAGKALLSNCQRIVLTRFQDVACIEQKKPSGKRRGIASLPLVIAQCKYMLSLTDDGQYYNRAWCAYEAMQAKNLQESYNIHRRFEHVLTNLRYDRSAGRLTLPQDLEGLVPSEQKLSHEADRKNIRFLERQSMLLGTKRQ